MKKSKNILIIMLIVIEIVATYFMYKSSTNKEVVLDNVELKEIKKDGSFAIMVETSERSGEYKEYQSSTWPSEYNFNKDKSSCINEKGEIVSGVLTFDESANKAYVTNTKQTTYCYLYFDLPITETVPTCSFSVSNTNGSISITFNKSDNAKIWYVGTTDIDSNKDTNYNSPSNPSISLSGTYYGYVKNSAGKGSCTIESKISQTSGCHSAGAGGSSGGYTNCHVVVYRCNGQVANPNMGSNCYSPGTLSDNCNGSTQYDSNERTVCECDGGSSSGPSAGSTVWTCQYDTTIPYSSQTECDNHCSAVAGTCIKGYTRIVAGAEDGQAKSWALCYKTFNT